MTNQTRFQDDYEGRRFRVLRSAVCLLRVIASRSGWWTTYDMHLAFSERVGSTCERTVLRYAQDLAKAGLIERDKVANTAGKFKYMWRYVDKSLEPIN